MKRLMIIFFTILSIVIITGCSDKNLYNAKIVTQNYEFNEELKYGNMISEIISRVRGEKSSNNLSLKTEVKELDISCSKNLINAINSSIKDFKATLFIENLNISILYHIISKLAVFVVIAC